jgi:carbon storage regulator
MLQLAVRLGQRVVIGEGPDQVVVTVVRTGRGKVRLGFEADRRVPIHREEIYEAIHGRQEHED